MSEFATLLRRHRVLLVEASAGTGKTHTLESLVMALLREGYRLEEILVVTFTERATAELIARLRARLEAELAKDPQAEVFAAALYDFDLAQISTLHGFCQRVLRDYPFFTDGDLGETLADGEELFGRAVREALRRRLAGEEPYRTLLRAWLEAWSVEALEQALRVCRQRRALPRSVLGVEGWLALGGELEGARQEAARLAAALVGAAGRTGERKRERVEGFLERVVSGGGSLPLFFAFWRDLRDLGGLTQELQALLGGLVLVGRRFPAWLDLADDYRAACLATFYPVVMAELEALKKREGLYDYEDMLRRVEAALAGPQGEELTAALRRRYRVALIDEFQDTDEIQWAVFRRIFAARPPHRLFLVGDPKQAIYGFRGADVYTYLTARDAVAGELGGRVASLTRCYRATPELVAAWNVLFGPAGGASFFREGEIRYDGPVTAAGGHTFTDRAGRPLRPLRLLPVPRAGRTVDREALGKAIVREIQALRSSPPVMDGRPVPLREVFVLTRSHQEVREVASALAAGGVPYRVYREEGLWASAEAAALLDVLTAVADPFDRGARLRAWRTPFFAWSWAELRDLRTAPPEHPAYRVLLRWHELARERRFTELFRALVRDTGLYRRCLLLETDERSLTNTAHLLEILLEETSRNGWDLGRLLSHFGAWVEGRDLPPQHDADLQRLAGEEDAVQVMTVHAAKGLEAAVVFLYGGFTAPRARNDPRLHVYHVRAPDGSWRRCLFAGTLGGERARDTPKARALGEDRAERERLLYVALTRARGRLYLPDPEKVEPRAFYEPLWERLAALRAEPSFRRLIEAEAAGPPRPAPAPRGAPWKPPATALPPPPDDHAALRDRAAPIRVTSYSRLKRGGGPVLAAPEERPHEPEAAPAAPADELLGGVAVGHFFHGVLEALDFTTARDRPEEAWAAHPEVAAVFEDELRIWALPPEVLPRARSLVYRALTRPLPVPGGRRPVVLAALPREACVREAEFCLPLPGAGESLLAAPPSEGFRAEGGYAKGFVDLLFRHEGKTYFLDWKSDHLPAYDPETLAAHVAEHYEIQLRLYALAAAALLGLRNEADRERAFGGALYVFLRGLADGDGGVYVRRPSWAELRQYEAWLRGAAREVRHGA